MTQYIDMTHIPECIGLIAENGERIVLIGVTVNAMPLSVQRKEADLYADFAEKYGIYFLFEDEIPEIDFYAVPRLDIAARDEAGGFIASVGESFSLSDSVPLVYISRDRRCYLITKDSQTFLSSVSGWKENLKPCDAVTLFTSKEQAGKVYQIIDFEKTQTYRNFRKENLP